jgi:hypothetical protein
MPRQLSPPFPAELPGSAPSEGSGGGGGGGTVTAVTGTAPIVSSGGATPAISITPATDVAAGSLSAADKTKLDGITPGAAVAAVTGTAPIVITGTATNPNVTLATPGGGIDQPNVTTGTGATQITSRSNAYTPTGSGNLYITVTFSGTDTVADDPLAFQLVRNPTALTGAPGGTLLGGGPLESASSSPSTPARWAFSLSWTEAQPIGTPVQYGMTVAGAGTLTSVGSEVSILELPAL